ncbi:hypothetical protein [Candidatus Harpocratesius sp.]
MLLSFDTCSLLRIRNIFNKLHVDLRPILEDFRIVWTNELMNEYSNYNLENFFNFPFIFIPLTEEERNSKISKYLLEPFDSADQDLVIIGLRDKVTIVTDDRDLFYQSTILKIPTFQLWSFCLRLVKENQLTKNKFHKCWKLWEIEKRYDKSTLKLMKKALQLI